MKSSAYDPLAAAYDRLQQSIDPVAWADYIDVLQSRYAGRMKGDGVDGRPILLDLGCGTGSFCLEMEKRGYDPIGVDHSPVMLDQAREKASREGLGRTLFLLQDITQFELYGTVDLIVCLLDTINHLTAPAQIKRFFERCANYLNPGGLLVFDVATQDHLQRRLGNQVFFVDAPDQTLLWQNHFNRRSQISRSDILLFNREADGRYTRSEAEIRERAYRSDMIRKLIDQHHFLLQDVLGGLTLNPAKRTDSRHFYICRKPD